jgi:protein-tyrosine-phosphatase
VRATRGLIDEIVRADDVVVTMGCGDARPTFPGTGYVNWDFDDPAGKSTEAVRPIRDEVERRVRGLLNELAVPQARDTDNVAGGNNRNHR